MERPLFEPHLAASPNDPRHLLGAAILADGTEAFSSSQSCVSIVTFDAGRSWTPHTFDLQNCGDPGHRLFLYRSSDGGRTWTDQPIDFGPGQDHQTIVAGPTESADRGAVCPDWDDVMALRTSTPGLHGRMTAVAPGNHRSCSRRTT